MSNDKLKILVVDDEESLRISLACILELEGFEVKMASSGYEAVELAKQERFDILFSDIRMQGLNGTETFKIIKSMQPDISAVMMTAYALNDLILEALNNGAFTCISKPFEIENILSIIDDITTRPFAVVVDNNEKFGLQLLNNLQNCGLKVASSYSDLTNLSFMFKHIPDILLLNTDSSFDTTKQILQKIRSLIGYIPKTILFGEQENSEILEEVQKIGTACFIKKPLNIYDIFNFVGTLNRKFNVAMLNTNSEDFSDLTQTLKKEKFNLLNYNSIQELFNNISNSFFDAVLINTDIQPDIAQFQKQIESKLPKAGVIYILPNDINGELIKQKGYFYLQKPFEVENVLNLLKKLRQENEQQ